MMDLPTEVKLEKGEEIKTILKRRYDSWIFPVLTFFIVLLIITPIGMIALNNYAPVAYLLLFPIAYADALLAVIFNMIIILLFLVFTLWVGWMWVKSHKYILTTRKVIIYKKFIFLTMREVTYSRITDIVLNVGIFGRLLNFGEIVPISGAMEMAMAPTLNYSLKGIFAPVKIFNLIDTLRLKHEQVSKEEIEEVFEEEFLEEKNLPKQVILFPKEKLLMILKRKYASFFFRIFWFPLFMIAMLIMVYITVFTVVSEIPEIAIIMGVFLIFIGVIAGVGILALFIGYYYVRGHTYIITTQRVIMIRIFFSISYRELDFDDISDLTVNQGPFARIFKYGTLQPLTYGVEFGLGTFLISMDGIENPHDAKPKILEHMRRFKEKKF